MTRAMAGSYIAIASIIQAAPEWGNNSLLGPTGGEATH
jgi:hypothetical protein